MSLAMPKTLFLWFGIVRLTFVKQLGLFVVWYRY